MAGEIEIGPDFDSLPEDIAAAFEMQTRSVEDSAGHAPGSLVVDGQSLPPRGCPHSHQRSENDVFVSAVSLWEIWLKQSVGKLRLPAKFDERLAAEPFQNLPLTGKQARQVALLAWHHRDPFDRMLVAQAQAEDLMLLTADVMLAPYGAFIRVMR